MRTIWSTLQLRMGSVSAQMANEANLFAEESWAVRTRNGGSSGWCGSAFSKFPAQLSCCVSSCFTDFRSSFDNFTPLVSVLCQIFQAIRSATERFHGDVQSVFEVLFLRNACPEKVCHRAVSSEGGDLSYGQHDQPNEAVIASRWCRCWEEKPKLKLWCWGCVFAMWCWESSLCESVLASLYAVN